MMKKRIGILTFHFSNHNYGALLQTYASVIMLRKRGFEPTVINMITDEVLNCKSVLTSLTDLLIQNQFEKFRKKFIPLTDLITNKKNLSDLNESFDIFYSGSDQVWRQEFAREKLMHYFLDFVDDSKFKMSYAASFGKDELEIDAELIGLIKCNLNKFNAVSVREDSGVTICKSHFGVNAIKVMDPTLMLDINDYAQIIDSEKNKKKYDKYIAYYELTHGIGESDNATKIANILDLPLFNIYKKKTKLPLNDKAFSSISNWLFNISQSDYVVTNSYHCMIFAILYKKNFIILGSEFGGNSRVISLLESLGLSNRFFTNFNDNEIRDLKPIEYDSVYDKLALLKFHSDEFLSTIIN
jgi:hypothetical protein